jgi:hypothetical protein
MGAALFFCAVMDHLLHAQYPPGDLEAFRKQMATAGFGKPPKFCARSGKCQ